MSKSITSIARWWKKSQTPTVVLAADSEWFDLVRAVNRQLVLDPPSPSGRNSRLNHRFVHPGSSLNYEATWKIALNLLGSEWAYKSSQEPAELDALVQYFDRNLDQNGQWYAESDRVYLVMKGYTLVYLHETTGELRYRRAADQLVNRLLEYPRELDGCLAYNRESGEVLVDTLGMICPFLARYGRRFGNEKTIAVSVNQLRQFIQVNVDADTRLPFHGYYEGGPYRLGLQAWGRGTGWYMLGLIDTLLELPENHTDYGLLLEAYRSAAESLLRYQRNDGHWEWSVLHRKDRFDSSTTSFFGYALLRGMRAGMLGEAFELPVRRALEALVAVTDGAGIVDGGLGECRGLGKYPQNYGPQPWLQGAATAFAALFFSKPEVSKS